MKLSTLALALGTAALLVGCGGGGGSSSGGSEGSSSSIGGSSSSSGGSSSSSDNSNGISQLTPISTNVVCDPAKDSNPPYTDLKYAADNGEIIIEGCSAEAENAAFAGVDVSFKDGKTSVDLEKIHIEEFDNDFGVKNTKTYYDYTSTAFVVTRMHGRDITGKLIQDSCTETYNPTTLSGLDSLTIRGIIKTPAVGMANGKISTTCKEEIFSFGDPVENPDQGNVLIERNYTFTPVSGDETKVYREETASY